MDVSKLKGAVRASDFEMHVRHLMCIPDPEFSALRKLAYQFDKEEWQVLANFLQYVKDLRDDIQLQEMFHSHVNTLRYSIFDDTSFSSTRAVYDKLFRHIKLLLWRVVPYQSGFGELGPSPDELHYRRVAAIQDNSTVKEALFSTNVLDLEDNLDDVLSALKSQLVKYHPDKNHHPLAIKVYNQVQKVYTPLNTLAHKFDTHLGQSSFCDLKEFLDWKLQGVTENKIQATLASEMTSFGTAFRHRLMDYKDKRKEVMDAKDDIIVKYRTLVSTDEIILINRIEGPIYDNVREIFSFVTSFCVEEMGEMEKLTDEAVKRAQSVCESIIRSIKMFKETLEKKLSEFLSVCSALKVEIEKNKTYLETLLHERKDKSERYSIKRKLDNLDKLQSTVSKQKSQAYNFLPMKNKWRHMSIRRDEEEEETEFEIFKKYETLHTSYGEVTRDIPQYFTAVKIVPLDKLPDKPRFHVRFFKDEDLTGEVQVNEMLDRLSRKRRKLNSKFQTQEEIENEMSAANLKNLRKDMKQHMEEITELRVRTAAVLAKAAQYEAVAQYSETDRLKQVVCEELVAVKTDAYDKMLNDAEELHLTTRELKKVNALQFVCNLYAYTFIFDNYINTLQRIKVDMNRYLQLGDKDNQIKLRNDLQEIKEKLKLHRNGAFGIPALKFKNERINVIAERGTNEGFEKLKIAEKLCCDALEQNQHQRRPLTVYYRT